MAAPLLDLTWVRTSPWAMNSQDGSAWIAKNGMGDGHLYTLYVGKKLIGVYGSAAEAKQAHEQLSLAPAPETR